MGKLEKPADASGWENLVFPDGSEASLHNGVGWSQYLPPHVAVKAATFRVAVENGQEQSLKKPTGDCTGPGRKRA